MTSPRKPRVRQMQNEFLSSPVVSANLGHMNWLILNSGKRDAAFNMALDEALLEKAARLGRPLLRCYGWTEPAATFGYFQKFSDVVTATKLRPLIRRPTGGGLVPHDADWTYSFIVPPGHEWHSLKAEDSYRRVHEWLRDAFAELEVGTALAPARKSQDPDRRPAMSGQCFVGHERFDLLWRGRKIAGAAQRRNRLGLLIQGSVQPPPLSLSRADWERAMRESVRERFQVAWTEFADDAALDARAGLLARQKYSQDDYNQKR